MKIAHIVSTFPPHLGGMGSVCWNEADLLSDRGHDVTVFTLEYPDTRYDDAIYPFSVVRLKAIFKYGDAGIVPQMLWRLNGFDIVHLHYPFYGGAEWLCFKKIPFVVTYHMDAQTTGMKSVFQKIYDLFWPGFIFSRAKKVIVVDSEYFKTVRFGKNVKPENLVEIFNGVDTKLYKPMSADLADLDLQDLDRKKIVLFVSNPIQLKRLDLLLQAMKIINDKDAMLVVVGGRYGLEKYKKIAKDLGIESRVKFMGASANSQQVADYYNIATCFVLPSDYESFALVVAEAMSSALPVIGSDIPAIRNRIDDGVNGFLFKKGSAEDLAEKLGHLFSLSPEERKKMGENGRKKVIENYSWTSHADKLEAVYKDVIKK